MWFAAIAAVAGSVLLTACAGGYNRPMQLLDAVGPVYPVSARSAGVEGKVVVRYDLTETGQVHNLRVAHSEPPGVFDEAAMAAVVQWRYRPPYLDGEAQSVQNIESTVTFSLGETNSYDGY